MRNALLRSAVSALTVAATLSLTPVQAAATSPVPHRMSARVKATRLTAPRDDKAAKVSFIYVCRSRFAKNAHVVANVLQPHRFGVGLHGVTCDGRHRRGTVWIRQEHGHLRPGQRADVRLNVFDHRDRAIAWWGDVLSAR